jgi:nitroreductase
MKRTLSAFCLCLLIAGSGYAAEKSRGDDMLTLIHARKSVRNFTGAPVSKSDLDKIVRSGMAAPSAKNMQPWSFVVVTDRKTLDALNAGLPSAKMLSKAGAAIIVCTEPEKANEKKQEFAVIDASLASGNILLATEALGLGGLWTACYPNSTSMAHVRSVLGIPKDVIPLNVMPIGVPTGEDKPKDKYKKEKVHWDRW